MGIKLLENGDYRLGFARRVADEVGELGRARDARNDERRLRGESRTRGRQHDKECKYQRRVHPALTGYKCKKHETSNYLAIQVRELRTPYR